MCMLINVGAINILDIAKSCICNSLKTSKQTKLEHLMHFRALNTNLKSYYGKNMALILH